MNKNIYRWTAGFLLVILFAPSLAQDSEPAPKKLGDVLKDALFAEEVDRNLPEAEAAYREILTRFDKERAYAATAALRLGELLQQRGETAQAERLYARVLREFADQDVVVKVARERLGEKATDPEAIAGSQETLKRLQKMLSESPDLLDTAVDGVTPLQRAAGAGELDVVRYLLDQGAEVNPGNRTSPTASKPPTSPLALAVSAGHVEVVKEILAAKPRIDPGVLHLAANAGNLAITKQLLAAGADIDQRFNSRRILDDGAAGSRRSMPSGSSRAMTLFSRFTALEVAAIRKFDALARFLIEAGAEVQGPEGAASIVLVLAANNGDTAMVDFLLSKGASPEGPETKAVLNIWLPTGATSVAHGSPLMMAAARGHGETTSRLLEAGANPNTPFPQGYTPLHGATGASVKALIEAGAKLEAITSKGFTPLGSSPSIEKMRLLIAAGADVNAQSADGKGSTPLAVAIQNQNLEGVKLLLDSGANVSQPVDGKLPLDLVIEGWKAGNHEVRASIVKLLVAAGADPNAVSSADGQAPLHFAVKSLLPELSAALIEAGANPNLPYVGKVTLSLPDGKRLPIMMLPGKGKEPLWSETAKALLDAGADINAIDENGFSLLTKAALIAEPELIDELLARGADPNAGVVPAYKQNFRLRGNPTTRETLFNTLFLASQLQATNRPHALALNNGSHVFGVIPAARAPDGKRATCPHSLFEAYGFFVTHVQAGPVKIRRLGEEEPILIDLLAKLKKADATEDVLLQWGDIVEFTPSPKFAKTERQKERTITSDATRNMLDKHLTRRVKISFQRPNEEPEPPQTVRLSPKWERYSSNGWHPVGFDSYMSFTGDEKEISPLPDLHELHPKKWRGGWNDIALLKWTVTRNGKASDLAKLEIKYKKNTPDTAIPEDGDVIVIVGKEQPSAVEDTAAPASGNRRQR